MESIVLHPQLKSYFSTGIEVYNEREITNMTRQMLISDRIVIHKAKIAGIIDDKTAGYSEKHQ